MTTTRNGPAFSIVSSAIIYPFSSSCGVGVPVAMRAASPANAGFSRRSVSEFAVSFLMRKVPNRKYPVPLARLRLRNTARRTRDGVPCRHARNPACPRRARNWRVRAFHALPCSVEKKCSFEKGRVERDHRDVVGLQPEVGGEAGREIGDAPGVAGGVAVDQRPVAGAV